MLAEALADRLNPVLPEGIWVEARDGQVDFRAKDGLYGTSSFDWGDLDWVVEQFLNAVQDHVAHATRGTAWPSGDPESIGPLPMPWVEVRKQDLRFGYGSDQSPVVFAPIPLDSITRSG